jgi:hypothetical protein
MSRVLVYHSSDKGFCRAYFYLYEDGVKTKALYCLQEGGPVPGVYLYRCTREWNPCYMVTMSSETTMEPPKAGVDSYATGLYNTYHGLRD